MMCWPYIHTTNDGPLVHEVGFMMTWFHIFAAETTGPIYKGNEADGVAANEVMIKDGDNNTTAEVAPPAAHTGHKEKSVLQAKLTKLAIQIGYAGKII